MSIKEDGGPAYPTEYTNNDRMLGCLGMSLRDYFAGQFLSTYVADGIPKAEKIALACYEMADAMIAERAKR